MSGVNFQFKKADTTTALVDCTTKECSLPSGSNDSEVLNILKEKTFSSTRATNNTKTEHHSVTTYSNLIYKWSYQGKTEETSSNSINCSFTNLKPGLENSVDVSVSVSCTKAVETWTVEITTEKPPNSGDSGSDGEDHESATESKHETITSIESLYSGSGTIKIYTKYEPWDWNISSGDLIREKLTVENIDKWCEQCGKYLSWKNQKNKYQEANDCKISSNESITAEWYRRCANHCEVQCNDIIKDKTVISAEIMNRLIDVFNNAT